MAAISVMGYQTIISRMYGMSEDKMPSYEMKGYSTPVMGSEDFHMLSHPYPEVPIVYVEVGAAKKAVWDGFINEGKMPEVINHNPRFVVEQGAVPTGTAALTSVVMEFLD